MEVECGLVALVRASRLLAWVLIGAPQSSLSPCYYVFKVLSGTVLSFFLSWKHNSLEVKPSRTKNRSQCVAASDDAHCFLEWADGEV